jgi:hypothetical protein
MVKGQSKLQDCIDKLKTLNGKEFDLYEFRELCRLTQHEARHILGQLHKKNAVKVTGQRPVTMMNWGNAPRKVVMNIYELVN